MANSVIRFVLPLIVENDIVVHINIDPLSPRALFVIQMVYTFLLLLSIFAYAGATTNMGGWTTIISFLLCVYLISKMRPFWLNSRLVVIVIEYVLPQLGRLQHFFTRAGYFLSIARGSLLVVAAVLFGASTSSLLKFLTLDVTNPFAFLIWAFVIYSFVATLVISKDLIYGCARIITTICVPVLLIQNCITAMIQSSLYLFILVMIEILNMVLFRKKFSKFMNPLIDVWCFFYLKSLYEFNVYQYLLAYIVLQLLNVRMRAETHKAILRCGTDYYTRRLTAVELDILVNFIDGLFSITFIITTFGDILGSGCSYLHKLWLFFHECWRFLMSRLFHAQQGDSNTNGSG